MRKSLAYSGLVCAVLAALDLARASESPVAPSWLSEVRIGAFAHDPASPEKGSADLNAEILFARPFSPDNAFLRYLVPRPHLGATANFAGRTSQIYAGGTWTFDLTRSFFVEGAFGGSLNNGDASVRVRKARNAIGSNVLFHEAASLGYRVTPNWSVIGTVEHSSNAGFRSQNRGLTNFGIRIGYGF